ncbi:hypothetical protein D9758_004124 [Tetrapyrgos nigripes]|uniref:Uncharacterized protein n=1 Tax=Tetrapyrgos nigripes TaxID=182062 RepID=A0A8H5LV53_9AGAR|nr:hypothetical protein D9758_004124 [Tetrapyrgos nigripes]
MHLAAVDAQAISQMFDIVMPHAARWKILIIQGYRSWHVLTPSLMSIASFPLLESFAFTRPSHTYYPSLSCGFAHGSDIAPPDTEGLNGLQAVGEMPQCCLRLVL